MTSAQELHQIFSECMPLFIALGDETRLLIITTLAQKAFKNSSNKEPIDFMKNAMNVNEITSSINLSRPAVSHHLKILKDSGLINMKQEGTANYYYLTLSEPTKKLMNLGYRTEEFIY